MPKWRLTAKAVVRTNSANAFNARIGLVKTICQLPVPPTFVPWATDELPGVSTSGHVSLEPIN